MLSRLFVSGVFVTLASAVPSAIAPNYWFSFGDSYTQTGFDPTGVLPTVGNPLGNPAYPGWTATGGANWIDQATTASNHSLVLTYNYAYGGATINASLVTPYEPTVLSLGDQVDQYLAQPNVGSDNKIWTSDNALFSVWIGINDLGNSYYESGDRDAFNDVLLDNYFELVEKLFDTGARNFLFLNVPPTDRSPLILAYDASVQALLKSCITDFNTKLAQRASALASTHSGVKTWIYDANTAFNKVLDNPTAYGFSDATSYGGETDFWGNNLHPVSAAQVIFGNEVGNTTLANTVW
ncbi:carbohydrate esterase family 16 protein [Peniophora sp. CONT]|nr:carbohydrate esterase family 16 protein [Peniophora sp. CONT]